MRGARLLLTAIVVGTIAVTACGSPPAPSPSSSPRPATVPLTIDIQIAGGPQAEFFAREVHAALADGSGRVVTWRVESGEPAMVPDGELVLDVWSVLFSDVVVCPSGSEGFGPDCYSPTLAPAATCSVTVRLVAGQPAAFRYRVLPQERCQLGPRRGG